MALFQNSLLTHHLSAIDETPAQNFIAQFQKVLDYTNIGIGKLSRKLQNWHELTFKQFHKELKKKKVRLTLSEEAEWMEYFNEQTDKEIVEVVYGLDGLSEEEVRIAENFTK